MAITTLLKIFSHLFNNVLTVATYFTFLAVYGRDVYSIRVAKEKE